MNDTTATTPLRTRTTYHSLLLGTICLCMTLALLIGYRVTRPGIERAALHDQMVNLAQVLPASLYDNDPTRDVERIVDPKFSAEPVNVLLAKRHGALSAVAFEVIRPGYGGPITMLIGADTQGNILGVRVLNHKETPGLGDHIDISKDNWITDFNGHSLSNTSSKQWHVKKDGGEFDQFTGATITPRAVVGAIHAALEFQARHFLHASQLDTKPAAAGADGGHTESHHE